MKLEMKCPIDLLFSLVTHSSERTTVFPVENSRLRIVEQPKEWEQPRRYKWLLSLMLHEASRPESPTLPISGAAFDLSRAMAALIYRWKEGERMRPWLQPAQYTVERGGRDRGGLFDL